ncbi:hypothetical protein [Arthrobacter globiformis]|uniref:hypothetical protein n=1 Tax=Arthrobacter globiformis TaxID=1665 RepID=UPI00279284FF|nr:hypothetical protein [Arthrobacter globiformis]MDQ0616780.1 hypothetical protein [Arthrobacter globiformis]
MPLLFLVECNLETTVLLASPVEASKSATFTDIPALVLERLLKDITGAWKTRGTDTGLLVKVTGTDMTFGDASAVNPTVITGPLESVVHWAAGRGHSGVTAIEMARQPQTVPFPPPQSGCKPFAALST